MAEQHQAARTGACRAGFVEGDGAVTVQVAQHHIQSTRIDDVPLIGLAQVVHVLDGGKMVEGVDVGGFNIDLGIQVVVYAAVNAERAVAVCHQFAQVKGDDMSKADLVGKIEFDQFVIDFEGIPSRTQADDALPLGLDTLVDDAGHVKGRFMGALISTLDNRCGNLLISCERCEFYLIFRSIISVGYLKKFDVGLQISLHLFYLRNKTQR